MKELVKEGFSNYNLIKLLPQHQIHGEETSFFFEIKEIIDKIVLLEKKLENLREPKSNIRTIDELLNIICEDIKFLIEIRRTNLILLINYLYTLI